MPALLGDVSWQRFSQNRRSGRVGESTVTFPLWCNDVVARTGGARMWERSTIIDVARDAGVSPATVSRVLNGAKPVSAEVSRRVRETVERLGYQPNPAAQGLLRGRSHAVGVVVPDLSNPYFAEVLKGVTAAADEYDRRTLIADTNEDVSQERRVILELARWWTASCCARRGCPTRRCVRRRRPSRTWCASIACCATRPWRPWSSTSGRACGRSAIICWNSAIGGSLTCRGRSRRGRRRSANLRYVLPAGGVSRSRRCRAARARSTDTARRTPLCVPIRRRSSRSATTWRSASCLDSR